MTPDYLKRLDISIKAMPKLPKACFSHISFGATNSFISARAVSHEGMTIAYAEGATVAACLRKLSKKLSPKST